MLEVQGDEPVEAPPMETVVDSAEPEIEAKDPDPKGVKKRKPIYEPLAQRQSTLAKVIKEGQNKTLRELIESFGSEGSYLIKVERKHPDNAYDAISGKTFDTLGHCGKFENKPIDEDYIEKQFGGGHYEVKFHEKRPGGSGWQYAGQHTVKVPGDPNLAPYRAKAGLSANGTPNPSTAGESPSIVKEVVGIMKEQLGRAEDRANKSGTGNNDGLIDLMKDQLRNSREEAAALRAELRELANKPAPPAAPARSEIEDLMFKALLQGDSARVTQMRDTHASEIRQLKEGHVQDLKRIEDRHDRAISDMKEQHTRELASQKASLDISLGAAKSSFEISLAAANNAGALTKQTLDAENKRLEKENDRLHAENKELRAKKDLSPVEMFKQVETIKNALGAGDDEESTTAGKIVEAVTNPATWEGVGQVIAQLKPTPPAQQQQIAAPADAAAGDKKQKRQIVVNKQTGEKFLVMPDGSLKGPLKKQEPKQVTEGAANDEAPAEPALPQLDPAASAMIIQFMESAFAGNQEPEIFAQGARSRVPEEWLTAIRDHGVDAVVTKMAKLSSTSPLSSQLGRNWLRKVGKALVGE